ncbi:helix-turn-helix transcriptional regulator [Allochromatium vinosum]|uniref:helix-turn-helix transcriptional regulator n=1 Tax=Allochromatium vinosum TaxID=1049 RepID=UPI00190623A3|nr:helix-turn-helix domain-containing protein [Allochromatium vinosum]MBK1655366.1 hypothetical protein [Allochromatium vinosum]
MASITENYLTDGETAAELRVTTRTLARWRAERCGPAWLRVGRRVLYRRESIERWLMNREQVPVREQAA